MVLIHLFPYIWLKLIFFDKNQAMKDLGMRLDNIYKEIEKNLSLQGDLHNTIKTIKAENQELNEKIRVLEGKLKESRNAGERAELEKQQQNIQNNKEVNNKIDELLSEVERCITLLKK